MEFLELNFGGLQVSRILAAVLILLVAVILRKIFDRFIHRVARRWVERTAVLYDDQLLDALQHPLAALFLSAGIYFALVALQLPVEPYDLPKIIGEAYGVTLFLLAIWLLYRLCEPLATIMQSLLSKSDEGLALQFVPIIRKTIRFVLLVLAGILLIQNLGYKVTSLITGLGIGGLAVALAAQDTLANFFGTVVMLTDRPFKVGDWVFFENVEGTVESIGFRSTRIRTWAKSLLVVPNKLLTSQIIENWSAMPKRRVKMTVGLTYDTSREKMERFVDGLRELLATDAEVDHEFYMVNFTGYGSSSLDVLVYYFTQTTRWAEYLAVRQRINLEIKRIAEDLGLSFAFPTQTLHFGETLRTTQEPWQGGRSSG